MRLKTHFTTVCSIILVFSLFLYSCGDAGDDQDHTDSAPDPALPSEPLWDGLSVASEGLVVVMLRNRTVVCVSSN